MYLCSMYVCVKMHRTIDAFSNFIQPISMLNWCSCYRISFKIISHIFARFYENLLVLRRYNIRKFLRLYYSKYFIKFVLICSLKLYFTQRYRPTYFWADINGKNHYTTKNAERINSIRKHINRLIYNKKADDIEKKKNTKCNVVFEMVGYRCLLL